MGPNLHVFLSIGIWYHCTHQFIVQRCLGARSEWDARIGVGFAGLNKIILALLVVIAGIVAFGLYPYLADKDLAFPDARARIGPRRPERHYRGWTGQRGDVSHQFGP